MNNSDERGLMRPTVEWMTRMYNEMNRALFGGRLRECEFCVRDLGRTLGRFQMTGESLGYYKDDRSLFFKNPSGICFYINRNNFAKLCKPLITLNDAYTAPEEQFLTTLVHEMCHYYTYMEGTVPTSAHGEEFKAIARSVNYRSKGRFKITTKASVERMMNYKLDDNVQARLQAKAAKRKETEFAKLYTVLMFGENVIGLVTTTSQKLVRTHLLNNAISKRFKEIIHVTDPEFLKKCIEHGFTRNFKSPHYYYNVTNTDFAQNGKDYKHTVLYKEEETMKESMNLERIIDRMVRRSIQEELKKGKRGKRDGGICFISPDMNLSLESPIENERRS